MALLSLLWVGRLEQFRRAPQQEFSVDYAAVVATGRMLDLGTFEHAYAWGDGPNAWDGAPLRTAAMDDMGVDGLPAPWLYPPIVAYLAWPWSRLDYVTGLWLWRVCSTVFALAGVILWWQTWAPSRVDDPVAVPRRLAVVLALGFVIEPLRYALVLGQATPLVFLLVAASMYLGRRDREVAAGVALALAAAIKLTPAVFGLVFLVEGRWRAAAVSLGAGLGLLGLSLAVGGVSMHLDYLANLRALSEGCIVAYNNAGLEGFVNRFFVHESYARFWDLVEPSPAAFVLTLLARVGVTLVLGLAVWRARPDARCGTEITPRAGSPERAGQVAQVLALWLLLVPSLAWTHYYIWILPIVLVLHDWTPAASRPSMRVPLAIAVALITWPVIPLQHELGFRAAYFIAGPTYAALVTMWLVYEVMRVRRTTAADQSHSHTVLPCSQDMSSAQSSSPSQA